MQDRFSRLAERGLDTVVITDKATQGVLGTGTGASWRAGC